jgi:hypothetical protein
LNLYLLGADFLEAASSFEAISSSLLMLLRYNSTHDSDVALDFLQLIQQTTTRFLLVIQKFEQLLVIVSYLNISIIVIFF